MFGNSREVEENIWPETQTRRWKCRKEHKRHGNTGEIFNISIIGIPEAKKEWDSGDALRDNDLEFYKGKNFMTVFFFYFDTNLLIKIYNLGIIYFIAGRETFEVMHILSQSKITVGESGHLGTLYFENRGIWVNEKHW